MYIEYDFHEGGDLRNLLDDLLNRGRFMGERAAKHYIRQIIEGLSSVHAAGFLYNDLKPENLLITHDGQLVLHDFEHAAHLTLDFGDILCLLTIHFAEHFKSDLGLLRNEASRLQLQISRDADTVLRTTNTFINLTSPSSNRLKPSLDHLDFHEGLKVTCAQEEPRIGAPSGARRKQLSNASEWMEEDTKDQSASIGLVRSSKQVVCSSLKGSAEYSAPESLRSGVYSLASDFWSLGCLVFDLFKNRSLFDLEGVNGTPARISQIERILLLKRMQEEDQSFPLAAQNFMETLLHLDPRERTQDFEGLLQHPWIRHFKGDCRHNPFFPSYTSSEDNVEYFIYKIGYVRNEHFGVSRQKGDPERSDRVRLKFLWEAEMSEKRAKEEASRRDRPEREKKRAKKSKSIKFSSLLKSKWTLKKMSQNKRIRGASAEEAVLGKRRPQMVSIYNKMRQFQGKKQISYCRKGDALKLRTKTQRSHRQREHLLKSTFWELPGRSLLNSQGPLRAEERLAEDSAGEGRPKRSLVESMPPQRVRLESPASDTKRKRPYKIKILKKKSVKKDSEEGPEMKRQKLHFVKGQRDCTSRGKKREKNKSIQKEIKSIRFKLEKKWKRQRRRGRKRKGKEAPEPSSRTRRE